MVDGDATIYLGSQTATRAVNMFARFLWGKEAPDHIDPSAPEDGKGRQCRFIARTSFPSGKFAGFRASTAARLIAWTSGFRVTACGKPKLFVCAGDPFELVTSRSYNYDRLHVRSWRPADEATWMPTKPYSFLGQADYGLTLEDWSAFPEVRALRFQPHFSPCRDTELVSSFPTFVASPAQIRS